MFMCTYASSRVKRKGFYRKSELQMFLLISGGLIGAPKRYTNMMSPYKTLFSFTFCLVNYRQLKRSLRAGVLHSLSPQSPSFSFFPFLSIPCPFPRLLQRLRYMTVTNNRRSPSIIRNSKRQTQNPLKSLKKPLWGKRTTIRYHR